MPAPVPAKDSTAVNQAAPPVTQPADTSSKATKQPESAPITPPAVTQPPVVTPAADTTTKQPISPPVIPNPIVPIDSSKIKQSIPVPADTSGHQ